MADNEIIELPLTPKGKAAFAVLRGRYQISDSKILEDLIKHFDTLSPAQQKHVMNEVFALGKTNLFPVRFRQRNAKSE